MSTHRLHPNIIVVCVHPLIFWYIYRMYIIIYIYTYTYTHYDMDDRLANPPIPWSLSMVMWRHHPCHHLSHLGPVFSQQVAVEKTLVGHNTICTLRGSRSITTRQEWLGDWVSNPFWRSFSELNFLGPPLIHFFAPSGVFVGGSRFIEAMEMVMSTIKAGKLFRISQSIGCLETTQAISEYWLLKASFIQLATKTRTQGIEARFLHSLFA